MSTIVEYATSPDHPEWGTVALADDGNAYAGAPGGWLLIGPVQNHGGGISVAVDSTRAAQHLAGLQPDGNLGELGDGSGLLLDADGNLKLSPTMLLIIFGGIVLLFKKPPHG
jgi:hypothetical protein